MLFLCVKPEDDNPTPKLMFKKLLWNYYAVKLEDDNATPKLSVTKEIDVVIRIHDLFNV